MTMELHNGDCLEIIPKLEDNSIQLVVTSPHYFSAEKKYQRGTGYHYTHYVGEPIFDILSFMEIVKPKIKDNGLVCLNLGWSSSQGGFLRLCEILINIARRTGWFMPETIYPILWHKNNPIPTPLRLTNCMELIAVFSKYPEYDLTNTENYLKNVIQCPVSKSDGDTAKPYPEEIPKYCINNFSNIGDTILDPFSGSGTTGKVALSLKRNYIGIDIDSKNIIYQKNNLNTTQQTIIPELQDCEQT